MHVVLSEEEYKSLKAKADAFLQIKDSTHLDSTSEESPEKVYKKADSTEALKINNFFKKLRFIPSLDFCEYAGLFKFVDENKMVYTTLMKVNLKNKTIYIQKKYDESHVTKEERTLKIEDYCFTNADSLINKIKSAFTEKERKCICWGDEENA